MWSFDAGFSTGLPGEQWESFLDHSVSAGVLLAMLILTISYLIVHRILNRYSVVYAQLVSEKQVVVLHHAMEFLILCVLIGPMTFLILSLNFEHISSIEFRNKIQLFFVMALAMITNYAMELVSRFHSPRPLLVVHHIVAYTNAMLFLYVTETAMLKGIAILVYFINFEVLCFGGLLMYRLLPGSRATPHVLMASILLMGLSRPVQVLWIVSTIVMSWEHLVLWQAVFQLCLATFFTALQIYGLGIHLTLWRRSRAKHQKISSEEDPEKTNTAPAILANPDASIFEGVEVFEQPRIAKLVKIDPSPAGLVLQNETYFVDALGVAIPCVTKRLTDS